MESPASLLSPLRLPFWGIPGSLQEVAVETDEYERCVFNTGLQISSWLILFFIAK